MHDERTQLTTQAPQWGAPSNGMRGSMKAAAGLSALALALLAGHALRRRTNYSFRDRTVIITGASRGLGLELARQLAREGARLWLVARSSEALDRSAAELRQGGALVETLNIDLREEHEIDQLVSSVIQRDGVIDVVVNNAGTIVVSPFEHSHVEDFEDSLATHFWAPLHLIRKALPHMRRGGEGRIVNISSIGGRIGVPHLAAYAAGKFALTGFSESLRAELAKSGIYVTTVTPGLMRTGSYVGVQLRGQHEKELRWFAAMADTPLLSMPTSRAARQILAATRRGRAVVTPLWYARAAQIVDAVAPNTFAAVSSLLDRLVLPSPDPDPDGDNARRATAVDPGAVKATLSDERRRRFHQPTPNWSVENGA
jgi:short-subunit dehydrogenase